MIKSWLCLAPSLFCSCLKLSFFKTKFLRLFWNFYIAPIMWQCTFFFPGALSVSSQLLFFPGSTLHRLSPSGTNPHKQDHRAVSTLSSRSWLLGPTVRRKDNQFLAQQQLSPCPAVEAPCFSGSQPLDVQGQRGSQIWVHCHLNRKSLHS